MTDQRTRAKDVIVEIIRQAGGQFDLRTNLYKAFYYAHLEFARISNRVLSKWPIVRMPNGPGIDRGADILLDLVAEKRITVSSTDCGNVIGDRFTLVEKSQAECKFSEQEVAAIKFGIDKVIGQTASAVSDASHSSRTWNETDNGRELPIYADLMTADEFARAKKTTTLARDIFSQP